MNLILMTLLLLPGAMNAGDTPHIIDAGNHYSAYSPNTFAAISEYKGLVIENCPLDGQAMDKVRKLLGDSVPVRILDTGTCLDCDAVNYGYLAINITSRNGAETVTASALPFNGKKNHWGVWAVLDKGEIADAEKDKEAVLADMLIVWHKTIRRMAGNGL